MILALPMGTRPRTLLLTLWLIPSVFALLLSASDDSSRPSAAITQVGFSADDFDWREMVPHLLVASGLPAEQGIKAMMESSRVLRAYLANEVRAECGLQGDQCGVKGDTSMLEQELTTRIDAIVQKGIFRGHKRAVVDYQLSRQPFPFSEIAAIKSDNQRDAYFILQFADRSYKAADVQAKYGAPQDTYIFQWYSVYKYQVNTADYTSKAVFEINPVDGAVVKAAVSVKAKKHH